MARCNATAIVLAAGLATGVAAKASGQTDIFWNAGPGVWSAPGNWNPVNVPDTAFENALIAMGGPVTLNITASINGLLVGSGRELGFAPGVTLSLGDDFSNAGLTRVHVGPGSANSSMFFTGAGGTSPTVSGSGGILRLEGLSAGDAAINAASGVTLTNAAGHTIDGSGDLNARLVNDGVISALDLGADGNTLRLQSLPKTNNSTIQANIGAVVSISSVAVAQGPVGAIAAGGGGQVVFSGSPSITGGRLIEVGDGQLVRPTGGTLTLTDVVIDGDLRVDAGSSVTYNGAMLDVDGTITLNDSSGSGNGSLFFATDSMLTGGGRVFLAGSGNDSQISTASGRTLTIAPGFTVEGSGQFIAQAVNNGLVRAFPSANGDGVLVLQSTNKTNNGLMLADVGGRLEVSGITITQDPGAELLADGGTILLVTSQSIVNGRIRTVNGGQVIRPTGGTATLTNVQLDADLPVAAGGSVTYNGGVFQVSGTIALNESSSNSNGTIFFSNSCLFTGGGRIFLGGSGNDSQVGAASGQTLTLDAGTAIEGSGDLNAALVNNGLVRAFPSDFGDGLITLQSTIKTNNTQMIAELGGTLRLPGIVVTQGPGAELLADGGLIELTTSQTVTGGTMRTANGGEVVRRGGGTTTLNGVVLDCDLPVEPGGSITYNGSTLVLNGLLTLNDTNSSTDASIFFSNDCLLTGTGTAVFLGGSSNDSQIGTASGRVLTIDSGTVIGGSGLLNARFVNNGLVRAFPSDFGDGVLTLQSTNKTNNTQIVAETDGTLRVPGILVSQDPGAELLADGGLIELTSSQSITGGTIRSVNGGQVARRPGGTTTLTNVVLDCDLPVEPGSSITYNGGTLTLNGTLALNDSSNPADASIFFSDTCLLTGSGTRIFLGGSGGDSQVGTASGRTLTIDGGSTIEGSGTLNAQFTNNGLVRAFPSTDGDGVLLLQSTTKTNNATILADAGGQVSVSGIAVGQAPAAQMLAEGGIINFPGSQTVNGGTIRATDGGRLIRPGGGTLTLTNVAIDGDLEIASGSSVTYNGSSLVCTGDIEINLSTSATDSSVFFANTCVFEGGGALVLGGGSGDSQINTASGQSLTVAASNAVRGDGTMNGTYTVLGTMEPGLSIGTINGGGPVTFGDASVMEIEAESEASNDRLVRSFGNVAIDGTLRVTPINDYVPVQGEVLTIVTTPNTVSGEWDTIELIGGLPRGLAARGVYTANSAGIEFINCPADIAAPFGGVLNIDDVLTFLNGFAVEDPIADYVAPLGVFDIDDVLFFLNSFAAGCD